MAATNRDLEAEVAAGRFRSDLFFRLNVFPIDLVPLRERREDIPLLVAHFLESPRRKGDRPDFRMSTADMERLQNYDWPGNIRELQNVLERAVILARDGRLQIDLPASGVAASSRSVRGGVQAVSGIAASSIRSEDARRAAEREDIENALRLSGGKVSGDSGAASLLSVKPTTLASRIKSLGIKTWQFRA